MLDLGFYLGDCMDYMKEFPDNYFSLAICDPPYGDGLLAENGAGESEMTQKVKLRFHGGSKNPNDPWNKYLNRTGGTWATKYEKKIISWDVAPGKEYFDELFRISRNQIIWGGNYFPLPPTRCFLVWRKLTISDSFSMAMCEYAWTSFKSNAKWIEIAPQDSTRFHPTQKPIALYEWILDHYAKEGDTILDTHVGSGSSLIACKRRNLNYVGFEIDDDYYMKAKERIERETAQMTIFNYSGEPG